MANEQLVSTVKKIVAVSREGKVEEAYAGWRILFESPAFAGYDGPDQRQALRIMITAKGVPDRATESMIAAHASAIPTLDRLVTTYAEPGDHELLGLCLLITGNSPRASEVFRAGLTLERARDPGSVLCGNLMKRVSLI